MALTRHAVVPRLARAGLRRSPSLSFLALLLASLLPACAEGPDGEDYVAYGAFDASSVVDAPGPTTIFDPLGLSDTGAPSVSAPVVPVLRDAGSSSVSDAGQTPRDAGTPTASIDSGAVRPVDAGFDAGAPKPVDAGPVATTDAGSNGQMCAVAPSYATTTACSKCTCSKCGSQITACYASSEAAKNTQCAAVRACAETNHCTGESCFCGSSLTCLFPDGPCKSVIETAAGSAELSQVQAARDDPQSALGRSNTAGSCQQMNCKSECGL